MKLNTIKFFLFALCTILSFKSYGVEGIAKRKSNKDFLLRADQVSHEQDLEIVIARGNVRISDGIEIVEADMVSYNQKTKVMAASGNVRLYGKDGSLSRANYLELEDNFSKGFIEKVHFLTQDDQRITAKSGVLNGDVTTFEKASYTPCKICQGKSPTWRIRSSRVKKDDASKMVYYQNSFLDVKGVPVFYTPYFSHPDPSLERKNGFLMPTIGSNTSLGAFAGMPYYYARTPSEELIIKPFAMSRQRSPLLALKFGKQTQNSRFDVSTSMIHTDNISGSGRAQKRNKKKIHGHIFGNLRTDINENWRLTGKLERVSAPTYLKKYHFLEGVRHHSRNYLTSSAELEHFDRQNYLAFQGLDFQNLNASQRNDMAPSVAPMIKGSFLGDVGDYGERWFLDFDQSYLDRNRGSRTERVGIKPGLKMYKITGSGLIHEVQSYISADMYDVRKFDNPATNRRVDQGLGRVFPALSWLVRYPLYQRVHGKKWVFTPIVGIVALPNSVNNGKIPNNDSQDFELDTSNLFSISRFSGHDLVDDGQRLNYGFMLDIFDDMAQKLKIIFGQSYSFSKKREIEEESGIQKGSSDYVGKVSFTMGDILRAAWGFRLDHKTLKPKRNTLSVSGGPKYITLGAHYTHHDRVLIAGRDTKSEQLSLSLSSKINENWTVFGRQARQIRPSRGELHHGMGVIYEDDCFKARFDFLRTFYQDRDLVPSKTFMLTLGFKNLGEYSTGSFSLNDVSSPYEQHK